MSERRASDGEERERIMPTKTKPMPPIMVAPNVERLMKGDMLAIRDIALEGAVKVSDSMGVHVKEVRISLWQSPEEDWEYVAFDIHVVADDETVSSYWEGVLDEVAKSEPGMSEDMLNTLIYQVGIAVERRR